MYLVNKFGQQYGIKYSTDRLLRIVVVYPLIFYRNIDIISVHRFKTSGATAIFVFLFCNLRFLPPVSAPIDLSNIPFLVRCTFCRWHFMASFVTSYQGNKSVIPRIREVIWLQAQRYQFYVSVCPSYIVLWNFREMFSSLAVS